MSTISSDGFARKRQDRLFYTGGCAYQSRHPRIADVDKPLRSVKIDLHIARKRQPPPECRLRLQRNRKLPDPGYISERAFYVNARIIFSTGNEYNDPRRIYADLAKRNINGWIDIHQLTSAAAESIGMVSVHVP
jgi:hypothetical protein